MSRRVQRTKRVKARSVHRGWWTPMKDDEGCVSRICMAAENPVAIINQKGSQPSVSRPAGQPRPACTEFRAGGFLYLRIRESCLDCHPDNRLKPSTNIQFRNCSFHYLAVSEDSIRSLPRRGYRCKKPPGCAVSEFVY